MNIHEYMTNPMKKGSSVLMLNAVRTSLNQQYEKLSNRISIKWYVLNGVDYVAHVKIPSSKREMLYYDVLLYFNMASSENPMTINNVDMKIFSNCPSFTYTYAYVYNEKGELIEWTRSKYNKDILKKRPVERNPDEVLNYERSLFFACKYISNNGRNYISRIKNIAVTAKSYKYILSTIRTNDEIENLYREYGTNKSENTDKRSDKTGKSKPSVQKSVSSHGRTTKTSSTMKKTSTTKLTKKTKTTKTSSTRKR